MLADLPASDHAGKNIHEDTNIDEAALEANVRNITDPNLIASTDVKGLNPIAPGVWCLKGSRGSTDPFDRNREVGFFHDPGDAFMIDGVSLTQEQLSNTSISIFGILQT